MKKVKDFSIITNALLDTSRPFPAPYLHQLSDLSPKNLSLVKSIWQKIDTNRRIALINDLFELTEVDTQVSFDDLARFSLDDEEEKVRASSIRLLSECEDKNLIPKFIEMAETDSDVNVRAAAAAGLGLFVYLGEVEDIPSHDHKIVEDCLFRILTSGAPDLIKRQALESLGYSSREDVPIHIQAAFESGDKQWVSSALFAMGRSADPQRWEKPVMRMISSRDIQVQLEAIRAAGELELASASNILQELLEDADIIDENIRMASVVALSKIGGSGVRQTLENLLDKTDDEEEIECIEDALEYLGFIDGVNMPGLLNMDIQGEDDLYLLDDDFDDDYDNER